MDIAAKLREIRTSKGLTGEQLSALLGKTGNSYVAKIESGLKKDLNLGELQKICEALEVSPTIFLREDRPKRKSFFDDPFFRDEEQISIEIKGRIKSYLPKISKAYDIKRSLGDSPLNIDAIRPGYRVTNEKSSKELAIWIREKYGLGRWGIDIFSLVRNSFNIYVLGENLDGISGIYSCDSKLNPIIVYNSDQAYQQRNVFTLAHELGHHLIEEGETKIDKNQMPQTNSEKLADDFASELLVPEVSIREVFKKNFPTEEAKIGRDQLIEASEIFKVSYSAINYRLCKLRLISNGTYERLKSYPVMDSESYKPHSYYCAVPLLEQIRRDLEVAIRKGKIGTIKAESILGTEIRAKY